MIHKKDIVGAIRLRINTLQIIKRVNTKNENIE